MIITIDPAAIILLGACITLVILLCIAISSHAQLNRIERRRKERNAQG